MVQYYTVVTSNFDLKRPPKSKAVTKKPGPKRVIKKTPQYGRTRVGKRPALAKGPKRRGGVTITRTPNAVVIQPKQPSQRPQPQQPGTAPLIQRKPKRIGGKVNLSQVKRARGAISSKNAVLSPRARAQLYQQMPKSAKRTMAKSPMPSGKTQLTKNKVEQIMPIEDLLGVVGEKPTLKYRFSCKSSSLDCDKV